MTTVPPLKTYEPMTFGRVGLVIGGESAEREVSLNGGRAVAAALDRKGVDVTVFDGALAHAPDAVCLVVLDADEDDRDAARFIIT